VCRNGKSLSSIKSISFIYTKIKIIQKVTDAINVVIFFHSSQIDILKFTKKVSQKKVDNLKYIISQLNNNNRFRLTQSSQ